MQQFFEESEILMSGNHGSPPRGLDAARSRLHQGRFGRMFRNLAPATFGATEKENQANLAELADKMSAGDSPSNGPDPEESGIPALYSVRPASRFFQGL